MARTKDFDESEVLAKAIELFWQKGYNGTSMQDLVDTLGISRSSLYDTFGDKHQLYLKALESYRQTQAAIRDQILSASVPAKVAIRQLLDLIIFEMIRDKQHKGCFLINSAVETASHDKDTNAIICENDVQLENAFYEVIKRGQSNREISSKQNPRALARFLFNTIAGLRVTGKSAIDKAAFEDIINLTMSVLG
ncbi:TetR/AcrR family transcriptional regulator [Flavitalea sp. BT771]|uniref:TetR/AcrR family transcriptional regulator n=1 Tax=Flavitalea sp. BT771 TaxID=3063329 RepID=UPI0026E350B3|nr:TetR/AcrR family transcriptional regulator [Flavitalea sp. BT771]MDO6430049.1 TetR/AcrR family transcriptional regulator [Flavitalea sp. BT771]MDV6219812.1 TetR/AcrR family transcriptional regulator [Flavitalea sp. BT771]